MKSQKRFISFEEHTIVRNPDGRKLIMKERGEGESRGSKARPMENGKMKDDEQKAEARNPMPRLHRAPGRTSDGGSWPLSLNCRSTQGASGGYPARRCLPAWSPKKSWPVHLQPFAF